MAFRYEQRRKRYAEDPEYRERELAASRAYHAKHRDRLNALKREKWRSNSEFRERRRAQRTMAYGLTADDYERMLIEQGGVCAICRRKSDRRLCIDHCHATQKVRGLLCHRCNTALGLLDDDWDRLRAAMAYVDRGRGVPEARAGCRSDIAIVTAGAPFEARCAPTIQALQLRAEVGRFGVAGRSAGFR